MLLFLVILRLQMPTDPPTSFYALSWISLGAMAAALVYVFRQWQAEKRNCTKQYLDMIDELMAALHDTKEEPSDLDITDVNNR